MALGQAAYRQLDEAALDLLHEMAMVRPIVEEAHTSLWLAWCLRAQEEMNRRTRVVARLEGFLETAACASCSGCRMKGTVGGGLIIVTAAKDSRGPQEEVVAAVRG
ncbi:unnamed protein product [Lampetra planeri]